MTVKDLRVLVENLDEYIHIPGGIERLKKTVLHLAMSGQLVAQEPSEGTGEDLYKLIQAEKTKLVATGKIKKQKDLTGKSETIFDIPKHWRWVRLGEIADYRKGPFGSSLTKAMFVPGGDNSVKVYEQKNAIQKDETLGEYYITREYYETKMKGFATEPADIIVSCAGTIGEIYVLPDDAPEGIINQALMRVRLFEPANKPFYIFCLDKAITQNMDKAMGTAIKNIPPFDVLKNILVPLPPIEEQRRIVGKVDEIFTLIDELDNKYKAEEIERSKFVKSSLRALSHSSSQLALENLTSTIKTKADASELRKAILHLAVSGKLVPRISSEGTGEELYEQIKVEKSQLAKKRNALPEIEDNEIPFDIPSSWRWTRVSDLGSALGQKVPDKDFYYVDVASIDNSSQTLKQPVLLAAKDAPSRARKIVTEGTVIYSTVRPYLLNTTVVHDIFDKELIASTAFAIIHPFSGVDSHWLLFNLIAQYFTDYTNEKSVGAAYPAINDAQFSMALMPLPPSAEQKRIVAKTTELLDLVSELEKHLEK